MSGTTNSIAFRSVLILISQNICTIWIQTLEGDCLPHCLESPGALEAHDCNQKRLNGVLLFADKLVRKGIPMILFFLLSSKPFLVQMVVLTELRCTEFFAGVLIDINESQQMATTKMR